MADIPGLILDVGEIVKRLYDYGKEVKNARKDINNLCGDLQALQWVLEDLQDRADLRREDIQYRADSRSADRLAAVLSKARSMLSDLLQRLSPKSGPTWQRSLKWPFEKVHVNEILTNLERIKTALLLAMMGDSRTAHEQQRRDEFLKKLHDRIAPVSPAVTHKKVCAVWQKSYPGSWFIDGHLKPWLNDPDADQLMALCGVSGAGKSTIVSRVIEMFTSDDRTMPVVYFYCTYNEVATHEVRNVLGSWLVQLSHISGSRELSEFERYVDQPQEIPIEPLQEAVIRIAEEIGPVLLVLDALNENPKSEELLKSMRNLLQGSKRVRCLVSTTMLGGALGGSECPHVSVSMSPDRIEDDVANYIKRTVEAHEVLRVVGAESILGAIVPRTQGMFRWASCQMKILSEYLTAKLVRRALNDLPGSLDDTYVILLQRVPRGSIGLVRDILLWLTFSLRPLRLSELLEAIIIEVGEMFVDDTCRLPSYHRILDHCQGLVVWDKEADEVTLAHTSVATFLESDFIRSSAVAYFALDRGESVQSIVQKSLNYVLMDEFRSGPCIPHALSQRYRQYPLLHYACTTWAMHSFGIARAYGELGKAETSMILQLFRTHETLPEGGNFGVWIQGLIPHSRASIRQEATPLYYAASFGLTPIVAMMFERGQIDLQDPDVASYIDKACGRGISTPLIVACYRGHLDVVRILLAHGADPNSIDRSGVSGRTWARAWGFRAIVRLMKDYGGVEKDIFNYIRDDIASKFDIFSEEDIQ